MRVAPIGYLYQRDLPKLRQVAAASALATHHHPAAQLGAVAAAFLVKLALDRLPPEEMIPALELGDPRPGWGFRPGPGPPWRRPGK